MFYSNKKSIGALVLLGVFVMGLSGCASTGVWLRDVEQPLKFNQPAAALQTLEVQQIQEDDPALYLIHRGMLLRMAGDIDGSIAAFEAAKPLITFQEATSISELASNLTLSEGSGNYQPPAFEQVQLHFYQALNRLDKGNWEAARIEAAQIDVLLERRWEGNAPFGGDAAARYLTGVIYEGNDEFDNAMVAYRKAMQAYEANGTVGMPKDLKLRLLYLTERNGLYNEHDQYKSQFGATLAREAELLGEKLRDGHGEVVLVASTGLVAYRYENSLMEQDPMSGRVYRISLPGIAEQADVIGRVQLHKSENQRLTKTAAVSEPLEDLSVVAERTLDDEMPGLLAKAIARNVAKNAAANEIGEQNAILGLFANLASAASESADVRSWSTLPSRIQVARMVVPAGDHSDMYIEYYNAGSGFIGRETLGSVKVRAGMPTVIGIHRSGL
ncbi:MAG: hypothetical protein R3270_08850 [Gammaproteobacteria bacterium]|nr:hypothetical protein [Gammaproteobacteria bacterium]